MSQTIEELKNQLSSLSVTVHRWGAKRAGSEEEKERFARSIKASRKLVSTGKVVLDVKMPEYKSLTSLCNYVECWWEKNSFPYLEGERLFRKEGRKELLVKLTTFDHEIKEAAGKLDAKREQILEWGRAQYPDTFDAGVYPRSFADAFGVSWIERSIDPPAYLERDDEKAWKAMMQQKVALVGQGMARFEQECLARMAQVASIMSSKLGTTNNRKLDDNVKAMLDVFDRVHQMKFEGTEAFKRAEREMRELFDGIDDDLIKKPGGVRDDVKRRLDEIVAKNEALRQASVEKAQVA